MNIENSQKLLSDTIDKLRRTENNDVKVANEMSNNLNWITTLTTLFFGLIINNSESDFCYKEDFALIFKYCFILLVLILIIYKIIIKKYVMIKTDILNMLDTHYIELKSKPQLLQHKLTDQHDFFVNFINSFRDGEYLPPGNNDRKKHLDSQYNKLKNIGWSVKWLYKSAIFLFVLNFIIMIVFLLNT